MPIVASMQELFMVLEMNAGMYTNGKNQALSHLYPTIANSRFPRENIYGIYLANPMYAWMALWMAVTNRQVLRKRQIEYYPPSWKNAFDPGHIGIYNPEGEGLPPDFLCPAHVLFFHPALREKLDLSRLPEEEKMRRLEQRGFVRRNLELRGRLRDGWVAPSDAEPMLIQVDEWQSVVTGIPELQPWVVWSIAPPLIQELRARVIPISHEPGADYIKSPRGLPLFKEVHIELLFLLRDFFGEVRYRIVKAMLIHQLYHHKAITIRPDMTIAKAVAKMEKDGVNGFIVTDGKHKVYGVLSLQDIAGAIVPQEFKDNLGMAQAMYMHGYFHQACKEWKDIPVSKVMRKKFISVNLETNIMAVMADFLNGDLYIVPVIEHGKLIGIVTRSEIRAALIQGFASKSKT